MSPDYILVSQAVKDFDFSGPDANSEIKFQFRKDRLWSEGDIKEVLSFTDQRGRFCLLLVGIFCIVVRCAR